MRKSAFRLSEVDYGTIRDYFLDNFALILPVGITDQKLSRIELLCRDERIEGPLNLLTTNTRNDVTRGLSKLISIFTINHTDFFREQLHFDFFTSEILPTISSNTPNIIDNDIRIWSAASSTGEEPYSILMAMIDFFW